MSTSPFVLTLELDGDSFARLEALRRAHYPPERNQVPAHLTLFHQLPGERSREIKAWLRDVVQRQRPIEIAIDEVKLLGDTGVAFMATSPQLHALRDNLAEEWWPWLMPQDQARFRPHVTIQNKAPRTDAERLRRELSATFRRFNARGTGLHLWRYEGGPWRSEALFRFG